MVLNLQLGWDVPLHIHRKYIHHRGDKSLAPCRYAIYCFILTNTTSLHMTKEDPMPASNTYSLFGQNLYSSSCHGPHHQQRPQVWQPPLRGNKQCAFGNPLSPLCSHNNLWLQQLQKVAILHGSHISQIASLCCLWLSLYTFAYTCADMKGGCHVWTNRSLSNCSWAVTEVISTVLKGHNLQTACKGHNL